MGGMAAGKSEDSIGPLVAAGHGAVQGASSSIARQMLLRGRENSSGYVKRRMAEMQEALNAELAKLDAKYAKKHGRAPMQARRTRCLDCLSSVFALLWIGSLCNPAMHLPGPCTETSLSNSAMGVLVAGGASD
jgi:hypothetical protein